MYGDIGITNGIGASPDGKLLYHSDSAVKQVIVHDISADGQASNRRTFATLEEVPDGLAVDESGRVWVAVYGGGCATCFAPDGTVDHVVDVPAKAVTSLCFGGQDRRDLYIVTADNTEDPERKGTVFHMRADVPGVPVPLATV
jgi:gluconolactonase